MSVRVLLSGLFVLVAFVVVTVVNATHGEELSPYVYNYVTSFFYRDTAARNAVAAVLLSYRMYDTMFEAVILLTAIIGMKQFLPGPSEIQHWETLEDAEGTDGFPSVERDSPRQDHGVSRSPSDKNGYSGDYEDRSGTPGEPSSEGDNGGGSCE